MRRMRDLIRIPVIDQNTEQRLGWVKDILFDEKNNTITGIIMEKDSFLKSQQEKIAREDIISFDKDSIAVEKLTEKNVGGIAWSEKIGAEVYSGEGEIKGTVVDIFVDNLVHNVLGYEISDGIFSDLVKGREAVLKENILAASQDVIVIEGGSTS
ncbi:MAG TPA: hypothetical protein GXX46_02735 [Peptococcaceae bacterium]|nr:hypothetical protein [Peptococcaceae bacterium]